MKKPIKPTNLKTKITTNAFECSISQLMEKCLDRGVAFSEAFITYDEEHYSSYGPDIIVNMYWYKQKYTKEQFDKKLKEYETKKTEYDKWFKQNGKSIEKSKKQEEKARLLKQIEKIEKSLTKYDSL
jgi:hypothetical protein